jgi:hypothetical protein
MYPLDQHLRRRISPGPAISATYPHAESSAGNEDAVRKVCHMIIGGELAAPGSAAFCAPRRCRQEGACQAKGRLTGKPSGIVARPITGHTLMPAGLLTYQREIECRC